MEIDTLKIHQYNDTTPVAKSWREQQKRDRDRMEKCELLLTKSLLSMRDVSILNPTLSLELALIPS
jgi:hypothetical protein